MSAGSDASNLGYGMIIPNSNINPNYVNVGNTNNPANFGSNEIPQGLPAAKNNIDAANSCVPGACYKGGKNLKKKIKNISRMYKMPKKSLKKRFRTLKRKLLSRYRKKSKNHSQHKKRKTYRKKQTRSRRLRGGYGQYLNNTPFSQNYTVAGVNLPASQVGLANPPPIHVNNLNEKVDNYNHFTNTTFPSRN